MTTRGVLSEAGTNLRWFAGAVAPWTAGLVVLISITATAGTDRAMRPTLGLDAPAALSPPLPSGVALLGAVEAGGADDRRADEPSLVLRAGTYADLDGETRRHVRARRGETASLFGIDARETVTGVISPGSATWHPGTETEGFVAVPDLWLGRVPEDGPEDDPAGEDEARALAESDGATPPVPRAVALSSMTPAPADAVPLEVAVSTLTTPNFAPHLDRGAPGGIGEATPGGRSRYADLIDPDAMDREQRCLAEAVYFEARSETEEGQAAVAQVVLNRVKSGLYPGRICGVVYQNRHRYMGCQFSFACEGKALRITDAAAWHSATRIAAAVVEGRTYLAEVGGATHYHANYVRPRWSRRLRKLDVIGRHIFYELKRGQT